MISLNSRAPALALFNAGQLLDLSVKLLNLPAQGTRVLCGLRRILAQVVCGEKIRADGGNRDPE